MTTVPPVHPVGSSWVRDEPANTCFACRQHGAPGLRLSFTRTAEHVVESHVVIDAAYMGWHDVIHGGIQATLLDEVMGATAHVQYGDIGAAGLVTASLDVRYRRAAPVGRPLIVRGHLEQIEGRDHYVRGEILDDDLVLTEATSVWKRVR